MPRLILGDGTRHLPVLFIVGERPGIEEWKAGRPFIGPAGEELWSRLWKVARIERYQCYTTNLVKTFSTEPPSAKEIARDAGLLRDELRAIRPAIIVTIGYHAARWFLPQFGDTNGDYFHGLTFPTIRARQAVVIPVVHPSAALRQPERYQAQLTADLRAVGAVVAGNRQVHQSFVPHVYDAGLAGMAQPTPLAIDSEGRTPRDTECFTVSKGDTVDGADGSTIGSLVEIWQKRTALPTLQEVISASSSLISHYAPAEMQALDAVGLTYGKVDDTMIAAYLLQEPQALKVLAYRLLGFEMREYLDLVTPLDNTLVNSILGKVHHDWHTRFFQTTLDWQAARDRYQAARNAARKIAEGARGRTGGGRWLARSQARRAKVQAARCQPGPKPKIPSEIVDAEGRTVPRRALSSIARISTTEGEKARRVRWSGSTYAPLVPLPPPPTWKDVERGARTTYALTDAVAHGAVWAALAPRLREHGLDRIYRIDRGVLPFLVRNMEIGLHVDVARVQKLSAKFQAEFDAVRAQLGDLAGHDLNPLAPEDVSDTVFDEWDVLPTRMNKSGYYTTEDKYLKARKDDHEGIPLIIEARQINKMKGTYTDRLPGLLVNGRYFPDWKYTRTASGRAAEQIILLIPKHSARGKMIRDCFTATPEAENGAPCELVSCDLSQIEMRVMAHESRDPIFLRNYRTGVDMHAATAHHLLGAPKDKDKQDESLHRLPAKTLNFGVLMGMTEYGLADQLQERQLKWVVELTQTLAAQGFQSTREFLAEWFKVYPGVAAWVAKQKAIARKFGYVRDMYGRRIDVSGIWSADRRIAAEYERKAHAIPIQSGAQGTAKKWIALIDRHVIRPRREAARRRCEPWVWVHDDVTLDVDRRIRKAVAREMMALVPQDLCVPATADCKAGFRWGSLDKLKLD